MERADAKEKQLGQMLETVSRKLGMTPQQLRETLESGKLEALTRQAQGTGKLGAILGDSKKMEQIMQSPQAQALYEKLTGGSRSKRR